MVSSEAGVAVGDEEAQDDDDDDDDDDDEQVDGAERDGRTGRIGLEHANVDAPSVADVRADRGGNLMAGSAPHEFNAGRSTSSSALRVADAVGVVAIDEAVDVDGDVDADVTIDPDDNTAMASKSSNASWPC
jgi:hypothetical protein